MLLDMGITMLQKIIRYFVNITLKYSSLGIFLGMLVESVGFPGASSVLGLTSGNLIKEGRASFLEIIFIASSGLTIGSIISYSIGRFIGESFAERIFKRIGMANSYAKAKEFLKKRGSSAIFLAQFHGTTRTWVSLPAGAFKMDFKKFTLYTLLGGIIYSAIITGTSYFFYGTVKLLLEQLIHLVNLRIWIGIFSFILIITYLILMARHKRKQSVNLAS